MALMAPLAGPSLAVTYALIALLPDSDVTALFAVVVGFPAGCLVWGYALAAFVNRRRARRAV